MNEITREVFVKQKAIPWEIPYIRNTNAQILKFKFCDYVIPENAVAKVYVQKPSGKAVYNNAVIAGNDVTVETTTQMFSEIGKCELQLRIEQGEDVLVTFQQPIKVYPNYTEGDAVQSRNESGFFTEYEKKIEDAIEKVDDLQERVDDGEFTGSVCVREVITGEAGSEAAVENIGTERDAVLKITIPRGDKGTSMRYRGEWETGTEYENSMEYTDVVTYLGSIYGCVISHIASDDTMPVSDYWNLMVKKGDTGEVENIAEVKVQFDQAEERENIDKTDTFSGILGKIAKWFSDLSSGAVSTLLGKNLTENRVLTSDGTGKIAVSSITSTVLSYLSGLTSNIQDQIDSKISSSKIVESTEISQTGFIMGGKTASEALAGLNGNSIVEVVTTSSGTAIKYANGLVEEFGRAICQNANGNVAMVSVNLPVSLDIQKPYAAFCSKDPMGNSENATRVTTSASLSNGNSALFELQTPNPFLGSLSDAYRTVSWSVKGFWK